MKKKVLITCITGQDGSYFAEFLLKKKYIVHGIKRKSSSFNTQRVDHIYVDPHYKTNFFLHYADLTDSNSIFKIISEIRPDEIYNLGAQSHVGVSFENPEYTAQVSGLGTLRILEAIRFLNLKKTKFYQAGTSELFGKINKSKIFNENSEKMKKLLIRVVQKIENHDEELIKSRIRTVPNWPKPGIMFRDITTLLKDAEAFSKTIDILEQRYKDKKIDLIAGIESRGFIIASALAIRLKKPFIPVRKPGKLPAETIREEYSLEYGKDSIEIHKDAIKPGENILLIDDLCATGGTMLAAANLIEKIGGKIHECTCVIDLPELGGSNKILQRHHFFRIIDFEGE